MAASRPDDTRPTPNPASPKPAAPAPAPDSGIGRPAPEPANEPVFRDWASI